MVTTFVVQTSQSLQVDYGQVTATLLFELIDVQRAAANGTLVNDVPRSDLTPFSDFHPTTSDSLVNGLWFTSLAFSLATALFAVLTKQWIHQYITVPSGTPRDRCHVRQFRYMGLEQWGVGFIIGLLPVLLSVSLGIFLVGLVLFLAPLQVVIASVVGAITFISFVAYFVSNFLPVFYPSCPYKTPLSHYIFPLYAYIVHCASGFFPSVISSSSESTKSEPPIHTLRDAEHSTVESNAEEMDVHALAWLFNMSSNPSVHTIVIQSAGILPLTSVEFLKQHAKGISEMSNTYALLYSPIEEGRFDRLARAGLCLSNPAHWPRWASAGQDLLNQEKNQLSPEVYAELLAISSNFLSDSDHLEQVLNLVKAQFTEPVVQQLSLQPIVWGHLLQKLLPLKSHSWDSISSLIQPLFSEISSSYWHADYKPLPLFLGGDQLKICLPSDRLRRYSGPVQLATTIRNYLSPYVADAIFQYFRDAWDINFHSDPADEFPAPQDPRFRMLLAMAGSPSIRKVPMTKPFRDSFFGMVMSNIGTYMDVHESLLNNNFPSFKLDGNRYSVLKLLYALISSDEFSGASMRNLDQRITLVMFLQVLLSTSPRPHFLSKKSWCTPCIASKFAQIVLQDNKTWTVMDNNGPGPYRSSESDELILYFLWSSPIVNQMFSHFVSGCHLDRIGRLRGDDIEYNELLSQILDTFIVRMTPDVLDHQVLQQFMAYIFEPENLFTICAVHICRLATYSLRRLAQVHPDHPAWPECLRKLDAIPLAEHFGLPSYDSDWITRNFSEFKEFVEGGCVGSFGLPTPDPQSPQQAPVEDEHPVHEWSLMKSLPNLWHQLRQRRHSDTAAKTEEILMNPSSSISEV